MQPLDLSVLFLFFWPLATWSGTSGGWNFLYYFFPVLKIYWSEIILKSVKTIDQNYFTPQQLPVEESIAICISGERHSSTPSQHGSQGFPSVDPQNQALDEIKTFVKVPTNIRNTQDTALFYKQDIF